MLEINTIKKDNTQVLFSGDLSVSHSAEMQKQLTAQNWKTKYLNITVQEVENLDLSFFQLLFSWAKKMKKTGKNLTFDFRLGEEFNRIYQESGFDEAFGKL